MYIVIMILHEQERKQKNMQIAMEMGPHNLLAFQSSYPCLNFFHYKKLNKEMQSWFRQEVHNQTRIYHWEFSFPKQLWIIMS